MVVTVDGHIQNIMQRSTAHHRAMRWTQPFGAAAAMSAVRIDKRAARFDAHGGRRPRRARREFFKQSSHPILFFHF